MWLELRRMIATRPIAPHRRYLPIFRRADEGRGLLMLGEPAACRRDLLAFLPILAHLGLLIAVALHYKIEGRGFLIVLATAAAALPFHYLVHYRWKKLVFTATSIVGLVWVLKPDYAAWILPIGLGLIAIALLPIAWFARVAILGTAAVGLALARAGRIDMGVPDGAWSILGSLFMFRLMIFLYELKHAEARPKLLDAIGYFFLLPNVCFLHFPVVDYRSFLRGYFADDIHKIQRDGLAMMTRGTTHLLAYRIIYHRLLPEDVAGPGDLAAFLVCNYLMYLRVSGQFHMACGLLHLFGYKLPETHHNYLLATSFTDYWRRINIYWKDFMVRLVFNPVAFRLKRRPQWQALAVATITVFLATWALHGYQSFWLRGYWAFSTTDAAFWGVLGALVLVNVQIDARNPARNRGKADANSTRALAIRAGKTFATFATLALLWSLWTSTSLTAWWTIMKRGLGA